MCCMLTLATTAFCLAILKSQQGNIVGSVGTSYLIGLPGAAENAHTLLTGVHFSSQLPAFGRIGLEVVSAMAMLRPQG